MVKVIQITIRKIVLPCPQHDHNLCPFIKKLHVVAPAKLIDIVLATLFTSQTLLTISFMSKIATCI